jgi:phosphoglycerol transferase MdoB-like AlkP superfamily enzyme
VDLAVMQKKGYQASNYAFRGIADQDMAVEINQWLTQHHKIFAHWITLNSHGPYHQSVAPETIPCLKLGIHEVMECNYVNTLQSTFNAIIFIAKKHPDVKIVISGDHAPHFESLSQPLAGQRINAFFDHQQVPALMIEPEI